MNGKINGDNSPSSLFSLRDSCKSITDLAIKQSENKYKTDALKLGEVKAAYLNTTQKTNSDYREALSKSIGNALSKQIWVKDGEPTIENYLFSFSSNKITPLNEKGEFEYTLLWDTMQIDDEKKTKLLIHFQDNSKFSLSNLEGSSKVNYHIASTSQDKLIGYWSISSDGTIYNFKPDMSFSSSWTIGKYSWNSDEITFDGHNAIWGGTDKTKDKLIIEDINKISLPSIVKSVKGIVNNYCCDFSLVRKKSNKVLDVKTLYRN